MKHIRTFIMVKQHIVIAIIDDGVAVRVGLEKLLGAFGYRIEPHTSAKECGQAAAITASRFLTSHAMQIS